MTRILFRTLRLLEDIRRSRTRLADLTDEQLLDIGLTRRQVTREAQRPPWDSARLNAADRPAGPASRRLRAR